MLDQFGNTKTQLTPRGTLKLRGPVNLAIPPAIIHISLRDRPRPRIMRNRSIDDLHLSDASKDRQVVALHVTVSVGGIRVLQE